MIIVIVLYDLFVHKPKEETVSAGAHCTIEGTVTDIASGKNGNDKVTVLGRESNNAGKSPEKILVYVESENDIRIGNGIIVTGDAEPFRTPGNPGEFNEYEYYNSLGYSYKIYSESVSVTNGHTSFKDSLRIFKNKGIEILYRYLPEHDAGIVGTMIFGEKSLLSDDDRESYRLNGMMHILAVSGLHVSMISMMMLWMISKFPVNYYAGRITVLILLVAYGFITGFSVSCFRAVVMIVLQIFARLTKKTYDPLSAVSAAGIILLLYNSKVLYRCDFLLSFGAVFGIIYAGEYLIPAIDCPEYAEGIRDAILTGLSVTIFLTPVLLYNYYDMPLYSVLINLIMSPFVSVLFIMAVLCVMTGFLLPFAASFFAGTVHVIILIYDNVLNVFTEKFADFRITGHISMARCVIYFSIVLVSTYVLRKVKRSTLRACVIVLSFCILMTAAAYKKAPSGVAMTVLDVGQGDGIYIRTPAGDNIMIDCGSSDIKNLGKNRIEPFLLYMGVRKIDYWIISHMDLDHYSALPEILERNKYNRINIENIIISDTDLCKDRFREVFSGVLFKLPETPEATKTTETPEATAITATTATTEITDATETSGTNEAAFLMSEKPKIIPVKKGDILRSGEVSFTCKNPTDNKSYSDMNNASAVFRLNFRKFDILLTGDIEAETEEELRFEENIIYEILKVAHHGSASSSTEDFVKKICYRNSPAAIISYGENNSYGHPSGEVTERFKAYDMDIYETAKDGAVTVYSDGSSYSITTYR